MKPENKWDYNVVHHSKGDDKKIAHFDYSVVNNEQNELVEREEKVVSESDKPVSLKSPEQARWDYVVVQRGNGKDAKRRQFDYTVFRPLGEGREGGEGLEPQQNLTAGDQGKYGEDPSKTGGGEKKSTEGGQEGTRSLDYTLAS